MGLVSSAASSRICTQKPNNFSQKPRIRNNELELEDDLSHDGDFGAQGSPRKHPERTHFYEILLLFS